MEISAINENQAGETNGYLISVFDFKDGEEQVVAELFCQMDQTLIQTYDTIMPPTKPGDIAGIKKMNRSGKDEFIEGEFFVISRKLPTDETVGSVLKVMIKRMIPLLTRITRLEVRFLRSFKEKKARAKERERETERVFTHIRDLFSFVLL